MRKAVILCGGLGMRLREETEFRPKPMVEIGEKPILWHVMKIYASYGINNFVLCLGYKGEMIKEYFYHYELMSCDVTLELGKPRKILYHPSHNEVGWTITLANTGIESTKIERLLAIQKYIDDEIFLMTYGDGVADIDIDKLVLFHRSHGKVATVTGVNPGSRFGQMKTNRHRVVKFSEKPKESLGLINGGFFVFDRRIFDYFQTNKSGDLEDGVLEVLASKKQLMVYRHRGFWACMDTYREMIYMNDLWRSNQAKWKIW